MVTARPPSPSPGTPWNPRGSLNGRVKRHLTQASRAGGRTCRCSRRSLRARALSGTWCGRTGRAGPGEGQEWGSPSPPLDRRSINGPCVHRFLIGKPNLAFQHRGWVSEDTPSPRTLPPPLPPLSYRHFPSLVARPMVGNGDRDPFRRMPWVSGMGVGTPKGWVGTGTTGMFLRSVGKTGSASEPVLGGASKGRPGYDRPPL